MSSPELIFLSGDAQPLRLAADDRRFIGFWIEERRSPRPRCTCSMRRRRRLAMRWLSKPARSSVSLERVLLEGQFDAWRPAKRLPITAEAAHAG